MQEKWVANHSEHPAEEGEEDFDSDTKMMVVPVGE
jgi:hypothetical protein